MPGALFVSLVRDKFIEKLDQQDKDRLVTYSEKEVDFKNLIGTQDKTKTFCHKNGLYSTVCFYSLSHSLAHTTQHLGSVLITYDLTKEETTKMLKLHGAVTHTLTWAIHPRLY